MPQPQGTPDRYHETVTTAYVLLINERLAEAGAREASWSHFAARNADLISPTDALTFGGVTVLFVLVAAVAALVSAVRASRLDPLAALRTL